MNAAIRITLVALFTGLVWLGALSADDWPAFRGPLGTGVSAEKDLPVQWAAENFLWKVKLPGPGTSSPITYGDKVFVTCYSGYGTDTSKGSGGFPGALPGGKGQPGGKGVPPGKGDFGKGGFPGGKGSAGGAQKSLKFHVLCFSQQDGKQLWKAEVSPKLPEANFTSMLGEHGYSTSTPATDGERVYVFFGKTGVLAFDLAGKKLWQTDVGTQTHMHGTASSLVLYKEVVIVNAAIESHALVALNKATGKEVWRTKTAGTAWASPLLVETKEGKHEVVLNLPNTIRAFDPDNGKELWNCQGIPFSTAALPGFGADVVGTSTTPVAKDGIVYVTGGGPPTGPATALAIKTGGRGDVTKTHVLWKQKSGAQYASPIVVGNLLYWIDGTVNCLRIDTGKSVYKERLYSSRGGEYDSPVVVGDKIYALTRTDGLYVIAAGEKFKKLAHNPFKGDDSVFHCSPAVSNGRLFMRSNEYLYCVGKRVS